MVTTYTQPLQSNTKTTIPPYSEFRITTTTPRYIS